MDSSRIVINRIVYKCNTIDIEFLCLCHGTYVMVHVFIDNPVILL